MEREARGPGAIPLGKTLRVAGLENCSVLILQDKKRWYPRKSKYLTERRFRLKSLES